MKWFLKGDRENLSTTHCGTEFSNTSSGFLLPSLPVSGREGPGMRGVSCTSSFVTATHMPDQPSFAIPGDPPWHSPVSFCVPRVVRSTSSSRQGLLRSRGRFHADHGNKNKGRHHSFIASLSSACYYFTMPKVVASYNWVRSVVQKRKSKTSK